MSVDDIGGDDGMCDGMKTIFSGSGIFAKLENKLMNSRIIMIARKKEDENLSVTVRPKHRVVQKLSSPPELSFSYNGSGRLGG